MDGKQKSLNKSAMFNYSEIAPKITHIQAKAPGDHGLRNRPRKLQRQMKLLLGLDLRHT